MSLRKVARRGRLAEVSSAAWAMEQGPRASGERQPLSNSLIYL